MDKESGAAEPWFKEWNAAQAEEIAGSDAIQILRRADVSECAALFDTWVQKYGPYVRLHDDRALKTMMVLSSATQALIDEQAETGHELGALFSKFRLMNQVNTATWKEAVGVAGFLDREIDWFREKAGLPPTTKLTCLDCGITVRERQIVHFSRYCISCQPKHYRPDGTRHEDAPKPKPTQAELDEEIPF